MRSARLFLAPALACLSLAAQAPSMGGTWHQTKSDNIAAAIESTVADMNFIKRPIARGRLAKLNSAYKKVVISLSDREVVVQLEDRSPIHMPANGQGAPWTREDGDKFTVAAQLSKDQLIQTFKNDEGERTNVFRMSADGKTLTLGVTVKSGKLPKPLTYTIIFGR